MILLVIGEIIKMGSNFGGVENKEETHAGCLERDTGIGIEST